jgi:hypothetical protein
LTPQALYVVVGRQAGTTDYSRPSLAEGAMAEKALTPDEAIEKLAARCYWYMCKLDPDPEDLDWKDLPERERRIYRFAVDDLLKFESWIEVAQGKRSS